MRKTLCFILSIILILTSTIVIVPNETLAGEAPTVTFSQNGTTKYVTNASTIVTVEDESGIGSLKYQWTKSNTAPDENTFTLAFTSGKKLTLFGENGQWYLWIYASDTLGNSTIVGSNAFLLDSLSPTGTISISPIKTKNGKKYANANLVTANLAVADNATSEADVKVALVNEEEFNSKETNISVEWSTFSKAKNWNLSEGEGRKRVYAIFKDEAGNQSLYMARDKYEITYNANGGTGAPDSQTKIKDQELKLSEQIPTNGTDKFAGWATTNTATIAEYQPGDIIEENVPLELYAVWKSEVTVTFDANGGTVSDTSKIVNIGSAYGTLPTPTYSGVTFNGWYTASSGGTKITETTIVTEENAHTLYAQWTFPTLYSQVSVGDYVNYPVEYKNVSVRGSTSTLTGWRVISKDSSTGRVNLVSAGVPLSAFLFGGSGTQIASSILDVTFNGNGFTSSSLTESFNNIYTYKNGSTPVVRTLTASDFPDGVSYAVKYTSNLYKVGANYWTSVSTGSDKTLSLFYFNDSNSNFSAMASGTQGLRPVVTLSENVRTPLTKTNGAWDIQL